MRLTLNSHPVNMTQNKQQQQQQHSNTDVYYPLTGKQNINKISKKIKPNSLSYNTLVMHRVYLRKVRS